MSEAYKFIETHTVGSRIGELSPEEFIALIDGVCLALEEAGRSFHGGVNAANISLDEEGKVGLGEPLPDEDVKYTAYQIEYIAPELFWDNKRSEQADVYSVGMLMYAWSNGGCLPFLLPDSSPTDRAEALRRKMSGERFELSPVSETLSRIIDKATAFKADRRYATVAELHEAFGLFREEAEAEGAAAVLAENMVVLKEKQLREAAMLANILAAAEAATATTGSGTVKVTKSKKRANTDVPAKQEEKKKMSLRPLIAVLLIAAILMVAAVAMQFGAENTTLENGINNNTTPNAGDNTTPIVPTADPSASPDITPFVETPVPSDTTVLTDPTPTPSIAPIVTIDTSKYNVVKADVSWNTAANNCIANGGNLVTINNKDEFAGLTALADKHELEAVWVGGFRKSGNIVWLSGETSDYIPWANNEPSYRDANGNQENFLLLVKNNGVWEYMDSVDDPTAQYSGRIGYIMEK